MALNTAMLNLNLPWQTIEDENQRIKKLSIIGLLIFLVLAIAVPLIPVPELTREEKEALPPELARVILEKQELPEPEPEPKPEPKPEPEPEEPEIVEKKPPPPKIDAREKAKNSGLVQFADDLAQMRNAFDANSLSNRSLTRGEAQADQISRSVIANKAKTTSGGIDVAATSVDTGGVALSGKENTVVSSSLADAEGKNPVAAPRPGTERKKGLRSSEDVRLTMDQNNGPIQAIYFRELRRDPSLEGTVKIKMIIEPNGEVSDVILVSSELNNPALERKLLARIRLINFGPKNVLQTPVNYTLNLFPA